MTKKFYRLTVEANFSLFELLKFLKFIKMSDIKVSKTHFFTSKKSELLKKRTKKIFFSKS